MKVRRFFWFTMLVIIGYGFSIFSALLGIGYISLVNSADYTILSFEAGIILGIVMLILGIFGFGAHWRLWKVKENGFSYVLAINILITAFFLLLIVLNEFNILAPINFMALWGIVVISYLIPKNYTTKKPQEEIATMADSA